MTWEQRWHPLREEWVVVAAHRQDRPWSGQTVAAGRHAIPSNEPDCPLCPGNVRASGIRNADYRDVFVFGNDHPCVGANAPTVLEPPSGVFLNRPASGIARFQGTTDTVTHIDPERKYAVLKPTAHPIYEHFRVETFARLLGRELDEPTLRLLGELMYQSHQSYTDCGLGSEGTDLLVQRVREAGPAAGLFGAKITGGGSGGTVAVLGRANAAEAVQHVAQRYAEQTGRRPVVFSGSSDGAAACGWFRTVVAGG